MNNEENIVLGTPKELWIEIYLRETEKFAKWKQETSILEKMKKHIKI